MTVFSGNPLRGALFTRHALFNAEVTRFGHHAYVQIPPGVMKLFPARVLTPGTDTPKKILKNG